MNNNTKTNYGLEMFGSPFDGENLEIIPFNMLEDLQTILCYDYEDGKPWHDLTCVMELIFHNYHDELVNDTKRIRYLYYGPFYLFKDFSEITKELIIVIIWLQSEWILLQADFSMRIKIRECILMILRYSIVI